MPERPFGRASDYVTQYFDAIRRESASNSQEPLLPSLHEVLLSNCDYTIADMRAQRALNTSAPDVVNGRSNIQQQSSIQTPQHPISIRIKNNSDRVINDVKFLKRLSDHVHAGNNYGNDEGIEITSEYAPYEYVLNEIAVNPISIGYTRCLYEHHISQRGQTLLVKKMDASGMQICVTLNFYLDPYANQNSLLTNNTPYRLDLHTELLYSCLLPNSEIMISLYPARQLRPAEDIPSVRHYQNPGLIRVLPVDMSNSETAHLGYQGRMGGGAGASFYNRNENVKTTNISSFTNKFLKKAKKL